MEFPFPVNKLFRKKITKVKGDLMPEGFVEAGPIRHHLLENVSQVVDAIGLASAKAQQLIRPVTSADRLMNSDHTLYILTDNSNGSKNGRVVGILKTGYKNLFLYDKLGYSHETMTLCVLDFFIHEALQRQGYGKELFDYMLRDFDVLPQHLALDRPSDLFTAFLRKHYDLCKTIPQLNHFVIYENFFERNARSPTPPQRNNLHLDVSAQLQMQSEQIDQQEMQYLQEVNSQENGIAQQQGDRPWNQQQLLQMTSPLHVRLWDDNENSCVSECLSYPTFSSPWHGGNSPPIGSPKGNPLAAGLVDPESLSLGNDTPYESMCKSKFRHTPLW